jgi:hypothetical protein
MQKVCNPSYIKRFKSSDRSSSARQATITKYDIDNVETCVEKQNNELSVQSRSGSRSRRRTTLTRPISGPIIRTESQAKRMHTKQQNKFNRTSSYRKKQVILKALTFKNGSNENPILITSHTVKHVSFLIF